MGLSGNVKLNHPPLSKDWKDKAYEALVLRSWWIFLFLGICYLFYSHGLQKKNLIYSELTNRCLALEQEKKLVLQHKEDLLLQINSQSDPAWIQLTLMKGLGVVPEGQLKVYFKKEDE
jgi:hypothetical protein